MKDMSRRNFVTLGALGAAGAAVCGLAGCAPQKTTEAGAGGASAKQETINCSGIEVNPDEVMEVIPTDIVIVGGGFSGLACWKARPRSAATARAWRARSPLTPASRRSRASPAIVR